MGRGGRDNESEPGTRRCLVTGQRGGKSGLVRFVVGPDDTVVPDILGRLPGRGLWVSADGATISTAIRRNAFSRGARRAVSAPADLADRVERLLARRVVDLVSLARKAGLAVAGYEKVKGWLEDGTAEVLMQALGQLAAESHRVGDSTQFDELKEKLRSFGYVQ